MHPRKTCGRVTVYKANYSFAKLQKTEISFKPLPSTQNWQDLIMTAEWLFAFILVIYQQIMDLLGVNSRKPEEHSEEGMASRNIVIF